ncbi:multidrug effflux MFS transporter [Actinotalea sp. K2]|uniref:multidrug effflux MFS transporter n=1 Tax=Actinotalea sp. K2 TaxID=2939438 RepID=UPI002017133D|nr:multidrug effflux MFS transporter [Actinotalea sp. K2]MCL3862297.1 multidrug effflux MFS transporter [Actinotalea sp. K2]
MTTSAPALSHGRARISAGFVLLVSSLTAIGPLTIDLYLAAFPQITSELATTPARVQLTLTATLAGLALGQLLIGSVSDAYGRRPPLIAALAVYVVASVAIIATPSIEALTVLRFVQGFSGAAGMVVSMAMVRDRYEGVAMGKVMARLMLIVGVAPILAPILGAQMLLLGSWRVMFAFLAGFGVLLLVLVLFVLPESLPVEKRRVGGSRAALASYAGLLTDRAFLGLGLLSGFYIAALFTYVSSSTFVLQDGFGLNAQQFALVFGAGSLSLTIGSQVNGALLGRVTPERILAGAVATGLVFSVALLVVTLMGGGLWPIIALLVPILGTAGFVFPSVPAIALAANAHRAGSAAALLGSLQFGIGAAIAPVTGLFGQTAVAMAAVMAGVITVAAVLLVGVRRVWSRQADDAGRVQQSGVPADLLALAGGPRRPEHADAVR